MVGTNISIEESELSCSHYLQGRPPNTINVYILLYTIVYDTSGQNDSHEIRSYKYD